MKFNIANSTEDKNIEELFSNKLLYSKHYMRAYALHKFPKLDAFLTQCDNSLEIKRKLCDGLNRGISGVESLREEINSSFEILSNEEKQILGVRNFIYCRKYELSA